MEKNTIPTRVAFVNINDGSVFFDCNPAEARLAMGAIKDAQAGKEFEEEIAMAERMKSAILSADPEATKKFTSMTIDSCNKTLAQIESGLNVGNKFFGEQRHDGITVNGLWIMNALMYSQIRMWGKSVYTPAHPYLFSSAGIVGEIWGYWIVVDNSIPHDTVLFGRESHEEKKMHVAMMEIVEDRATIPVTVNQNDFVGRLHADAGKLEKEAIGLFSGGELHAGHKSADTARCLRIAANHLDGIAAG